MYTIHRFEQDVLRFSLHPCAHDILSNKIQDFLLTSTILLTPLIHSLSNKNTPGSLFFFPLPLLSTSNASLRFFYSLYLSFPWWVFFFFFGLVAGLQFSRHSHKLPAGTGICQGFGSHCAPHPKAHSVWKATLNHNLSYCKAARPCFPVVLYIRGSQPT